MNFAAVLTTGRALAARLDPRPPLHRLIDTWTLSRSILMFVSIIGPAQIGSWLLTQHEPFETAVVVCMTIAWMTFGVSYAAQITLNRRLRSLLDQKQRTLRLVTETLVQGSPSQTVHVFLSADTPPSSRHRVHDCGCEED